MSDNGFKQSGGWLPKQDDLESWLEELTQRVDSDGPKPLHPAVAELGTLVESDPLLRMNATRMILQEPDDKDYAKQHIRDFPHLLQLISAVIGTAPEFSTDAMVMVPLNGLLDRTMGTDAGFSFYRDPRVNAALKKILDAWCAFLSAPDSLYVLNDGPDGWMSKKAEKTVGIEQFQHDPAAPHWGFQSWNDFFTRRLADGARPVAEPDDDRVIVNACESTPYHLGTDVKRRDEFWVKGQPYSLDELLAGDESVDDFVGGTVYQAFLSATEYHRWHSPVAGTIERAFVVGGTYYSEVDSEGEDAEGPDKSQGYLAHVATRAIVIIRADNPRIGRVAVVPVGMGDVSSCVIGEGIAPGAHVAKGAEIGYFQFGGSTHCVVFEPGAIARFAEQAVPKPKAGPVKVRTHLATAAG